MTGKASNHWAREGGFTLIEVVVTMGLLGIVLALLLVPVFNSLGYFRSATARADAQNAARIALDSVARELTEAMYVQLDMYDNSLIAFVPPLRVDPEDPNSEIVTPPRPDWSQAIRYWPALFDPTANYNPSGRLAPANTFFLARTVVPEPLTYDDPWNRWNQDWAQAQDADGAEGIADWAAISRVVHTDVDWRFAPGQIGKRSATLQPGYPYLDVQYRLANGTITQTQASRLYRDNVVALTPNATEYDVSQLEFTPYVVAGEWLRPVRGTEKSDYSTYRARYPLWRLGAPYTGWAQLSDDPFVHDLLRQLPWARDPFLLIYRYDTSQGAYALHAIGAFDPRTRTMKVLDTNTQSEVYDTGQYPYRPAIASTAFGVDWIDASLLCAFPPEGDETAMKGGAPYMFVGGELQPATAGDSTVIVYDKALRVEWANRTGGDALTSFVNPESVEVRVDTNGDGVPERTLTRVFCTPRSGWDEFQLGVDPAELGKNSPAAKAPEYGYIRLPQWLAGSSMDPRNFTYYADFRWRGNGVVPAGGTLTDEKPDLISAYYRTASVIDITITVTRANPAATAGQKVAQSAHMTRRVKLRNLLREIRYEE